MLRNIGKQSRESQGRVNPEKKKREPTVGGFAKKKEGFKPGMKE